MSLFDKTIKGLGATIDMRQIKHGVISSNIANAETPGYKAQKMDFERQLARALDTDKLRRIQASDKGHIGFVEGGIESVRADIYDNPDINLTNDQNTVDLEKEMAVLAQNSIMYRAAVQLINKKLATMKYAAMDGR